MSEKVSLLSVGSTPYVVNIDSSTEEVTPHLRWLKGTLQQAWIVIHYSGGVPLKRITEWRIVPTEEST